MFDDYLLAKQILSKYEDNPYYPLFVVSFYSLLEKYPNYQELIIYLFRNTRIYIENGSISNIIKKYNLNYTSYKDDPLTYAISFTSDGCDLRNGEFIATTSYPTIICDSSKSISPTDLLNTFLHEMNHLVKGTLNSFSLHNTSTGSYFSCRTGLYTCDYEYNYESKSIFVSEKFNLLDEVINTIQTTELVQNAFSLDGIVPDSKIQEYIDSLSILKARKDFGYIRTTPFLRPLWEIDEFRTLIEDNIIDGNISTIINEFDSVVGEGSFGALDCALETIHNATSARDESYKQAKKCISDIIEKYRKQKRLILS